MAIDIVSVGTVTNHAGIEHPLLILEKSVSL